jgi:hypothetical protein
MLDLVCFLSFHLLYLENCILRPSITFHAHTKMANFVRPRLAPNVGMEGEAKQEKGYGSS